MSRDVPRAQWSGAICLDEWQLLRWRTGSKSCSDIG